MRRLLLMLLPVTLVPVTLVPLAATPAAAQHISFQAASFMAECDYSHAKRDDPIVYPGQPGASHSHDFFANTTTNAYSTYKTLQAGTTKCDDQQDRSGYWVPSLYKNGTKVNPTSVNAYYSLNNKVPGDIKPFPPDFRVIAGDGHATAPQKILITSWGCVGRLADGRQVSTAVSEPPSSCPSGTYLVLRVDFPDCGNGAIDSPDHRSHVARSTKLSDGHNHCPASHPVKLPALKLVVRFKTLANGQGVSLSSGGVYSAHADFLNSWVQTRLQDRVTVCLNGVRKCR